MRILVIDDSPVARIALRGMLEAAGFTIVEAADGKEGLRTFRSVGADVVVCDLFMPGVDGLQVIRELRREFPAVKLIAISGGSSNCTMDVLPMAQRLGADEVLYKPFGPAALLAAIREVLQRPAWTLASAKAGQCPPREPLGAAAR
jgi:DNA-binding response OmpR family regulator